VKYYNGEELQTKEDVYMNKVAIVTGGGSGLGQAVALRLAKEGIHIAVVDIQEEGGNATVKQAKALGVASFFCEGRCFKAGRSEKLCGSNCRPVWHN